MEQRFEFAIGDVVVGVHLEGFTGNIKAATIDARGIGYWVEYRDNVGVVREAFFPEAELTNA